MTQPQSYSWFIDQAAPGPGGQVPGQAFNAGNALGCVPCYLTQQDLLDLIDRVLPLAYIDPIKNVGPGYELYQAAAAAMSRASLAVGRLECEQFILSATGGAYATAQVAFYRADAAHGVVTVKAGTIVSSSRGGLRYILPADVALGSGDLATSGVVVQAIAQGYEYNLPGPKVTARGEVRQGEIDTVDLPLQDPPYGDPTILVQQLADAEGGVSPALDGLGRDRGIDRAQAEGDSQYAARIRSLPDTVTPAAMRRFLARSLARFTKLGVSAPVFIETWWVGFQTCWDAPAQTYAGPGFAADYDPNLFVWDDPRPSPPLRDLWLSGDFERGAFVVLVPRLEPILDVGTAWDDEAADLGDLRSSYGLRALAAWDIPQGFTDAPGFCWDGRDIGQSTLFEGLWESLQQVKPAGAAVELIQEGY